ncbi:pilus assembly protein PilZ [Halobacillus fulvus]|nr:pilus assembly protein PilZ [Halobacillus fulvus]
MSVINVGMPLMIELYTQAEDEPEKYKCKLVDYKDGYFYIDYPVHSKTGKTGFFMDGTQFQVSFVAQDQSVYWFETEVVKRKKMNIPVIVLTFPGEEKLVRIQRRRYVRVEAAVDAAVEGENSSFTTVTSDISGGGVALILPDKSHVKENEIIDMVIVLPMNAGGVSYITTKGKVIRVIGKTQYHPARVSIEFKDLLEKHRQKIIQYCFEQQMHRRKRGLTAK